MKLQKTKQDQYIVTLPKQIIIALGWEKGIKLGFKLENKRLILSRE